MNARGRGRGSGTSGPRREPPLMASKWQSFEKGRSNSERLGGAILRRQKSRRELLKEENEKLQARIDAMPKGLGRGKTPPS